MTSYIDILAREGQIQKHHKAAAHWLRDIGQAHPVWIELVRECGRIQRDTQIRFPFDLAITLARVIIRGQKFAATDPTLGMVREALNYAARLMPKEPQT